jgi:hypothetical protein
MTGNARAPARDPHRRRRRIAGQSVSDAEERQLLSRRSSAWTTNTHGAAVSSTRATSSLETRTVARLRVMRAGPRGTEVSYVRRLTHASTSSKPRPGAGAATLGTSSTPCRRSSPTRVVGPGNGRLPMRWHPQRAVGAEVRRVRQDAATSWALSPDDLPARRGATCARARGVGSRRALFAVIDRVDLVLAERLQAYPAHSISGAGRIFELCGLPCWASHLSARAAGWQRRRRYERLHPCPARHLHAPGVMVDVLTRAIPRTAPVVVVEPGSACCT